MEVKNIGNGRYLFEYSKQTPVYQLNFREGTYRIECWGASGGLNPVPETGFGAYVSGIIRFIEPRTLYAVLGEKGTFGETNVQTQKSTFNGGGEGGVQTY